MRQIDIELDYLNQILLKMADIVQKNIQIACDYFESDKTNQVCINDDIVDQHERLVEEVCLDILTKERPYSSDLRKVSGVLKLVEDLERIGDHAEDIVEFTNKIKCSPVRLLFDTQKLFTTSLEMIKNAILSFVKNDKELAQNVIDKDDLVDKMYEEAINELISKVEEKIDGPYIIYTTLVVKYIERIADHAVNIAEWVIYIINGYHKDKQIF